MFKRLNKTKIVKIKNLKLLISNNKQRIIMINKINYKDMKLVLI